ncbi:putative DNA processing protein DprA [Mycobacterium antarcticum]|uniref:DNA-processing protein DprA n=1 Tax=unclassified Mycolicibacterium TaxID=2636767 RepID=UPI002398F9DC|nr:MULTISPECIES: DNA-processing protein DprA [unclassified Mycolicibacterium]BDX33129.1 putative DNA processing protein DprA [Mycolicibacterium sp. TUM20985]GLP76303.1 putative DNA processing protein DprA [Mycolicibacterium sp. TUM20983]GLP83317.1 putative DNA processing protein DprA [Mycolicibacterium sp. TUM20984]
MNDESRAWAYLSRVVEPPCHDLAEYVTRVGPVEAADRIKRDAAPRELARLTAARRELDCATKDLDVIGRLGGRLLTPGDADWPLLAFTSFSGQPVRDRPAGRAPMVLWVIGQDSLADVAERGCAIVGTRAATSYGEYQAADLAAGLAERDVAVVSGGAFGIDGVAHRAALGAEGLTVAVLAGGVDVPYPSAHSAMLRRIGEQGLLVSEYPPGVRPARHRFLTRNRLVAALSGATVVVEAGLRSGAASTAAWAEALGRPVCAYPGPVTSSASAGCHVLIRNGALLVTRVEEVVELVGAAGEIAPEPARPVSPLDGLTDVELRTYDALPARGARTVDQIAVAAGMPPTEVLGPLATLELAGLVRRRDGRWRIALR